MCSLWRCGEDATPPSSRTTPELSPLAVRISTTDGSLAVVAALWVKAGLKCADGASGVPGVPALRVTWLDG
jgi:hypothetical protein